MEEHDYPDHPKGHPQERPQSDVPRDTVPVPTVPPRQIPRDTVPVPLNLPPTGPPNRARGDFDVELPPVHVRNNPGSSQQAGHGSEQQGAPVPPGQAQAGAQGHAAAGHPGHAQVPQAAQGHGQAQHPQAHPHAQGTQHPQRHPHPHLHPHPHAQGHTQQAHSHGPAGYPHAGAPQPAHPPQQQRPAAHGAAPGVQEAPRQPHPGRPIPGSRPYPQPQAQPQSGRETVGRHHPQQPAAAAVEKSGLTAVGAFGMAMLANLVLLFLLASLVWAFPKETGGLVERIATRMGLASPANSPGAALVPGVDSAADRLEILELEDRAIFRGERTALEQLQRLSQELDPADLGYDAVQASLIRIRQRYQLSQGEIPPPLDAREILPGAETEKDLPVTAIVDVLRNRRQPPSKRQRAAYLLAHSRQSAAAKNALFHAIQDDPNLGVVRQSFQAFQELTGYPGRDFFDSDAIDRWWARNATSFIGQNTP